MYVELLEGDGDAVFAERVVEAFLDVEPGVPIVGFGGPVADGKVDGGLRHSAHDAKGLRILDDEGVVFEIGEDDGADVFGVGAVGGADGEVAAAGALGGHVGNNGVGQLAVWDGYVQVLDGAYGGVKKVLVYDLAGFIVGVDPVSDAEGMGYEEDDAARDISQRTLQCEGECAADGGHKGDDGSDGNAQNGNEYNNKENIQADSEGGAQVLPVAGVEAFQPLPFSDLTGDVADQHFRKDKDDEGGDCFKCVFGGYFGYGCPDGFFVHGVAPVCQVLLIVTHFWLKFKDFVMCKKILKKSVKIC